LLQRGDFFQFQAKKIKATNKSDREKVNIVEASNSMIVLYLVSPATNKVLCLHLQVI
jgi:hypothetical protein